MDFNLTEEKINLQNMVKEFSDNEIWPNSTEWDDNQEFPYGVFKKMSEIGLMGLLIPEEYGGSGEDMLSYVVAMEEISRGCPSIGLTWGGHMSLGSQPFVLYGSKQQKEKYLPKLASGEFIGAFGLTEPDAGSDAGAVKTTADLKENEWLINGTKTFISNAGTDISYGVVILAKTGQRDDGRPEFSSIVIDKGTPGYKIGRKFDKLAWNSGDTRELIFEECRVPVENMVGEKGRGLSNMLAVLALGRVGYAATCVGIAQRAYELGLEYSKQRVQFGRSLSSFQLVQSKIAKMAVDINAARMLTYKAAWLVDEGKDFGLDAAMAKYFASEIAFNAIAESIQIFGGYGFTKEYPINRLYRMAPILKVGEGANEILETMVIARGLGCY